MWGTSVLRGLLFSRLQVSWQLQCRFSWLQESFWLEEQAYYWLVLRAYYLLLPLALLCDAWPAVRCRKCRN